MKKALLTVIIALAAGVGAWAGKPARVHNLVSQYKHNEGFEVVTLGKLGTSLLKGAIMLSSDMDKEDRAALRVFADIKSISIVDFEEARPEVKERFVRKLEKILDDMELILEANEDGERVRIFGVEDGNRVRDCILFSSDGALIVTEGGIDLDKVAKLMELQQ